ncbi:hypothetical protein OEZ86_013105 [Tetradesmus obliquus]|nr:hypothetical protein OEZ86_013105 [Tetradesmus obliquus]
MATRLLPVPRVVEELEKARTVLADVGFDLAKRIPSIVVIGDQSTGKSSLLSALTGLQLLTGDDTVTRAPLKIFIRPGTEHKATLHYRLLKQDGSFEPKEEELPAAALSQQPEKVSESIRIAQQQMYESLKAAGNGAGSHVLGSLIDNTWLLKDHIELFVDMPGEKGCFTVVDLPGLHRPQGRDVYTKKLEDWVTEKIAPDNVIILSAMTAATAVAAGKTNLSVANSLAYNVDPQCRRTLSIITMADKATDKITQVLQAAVRNSKEPHTGCVVVATNPLAGQTEEDCLQQFQGDAAFKELETAGGGLGVKHLFQKLVDLQEAMVLKLDRRSLMSELQYKLDGLNSSLKSYEKQPDTEAAAEELVRGKLRLVQLSFFNSCKNASSADDGGANKDTMIDAMDAAAKSYVKKQSSFIPGILGQESVLKIVMKSIKIDTETYHCDLPSEYTAVEIFLEFHKDVAKDAVKFVVEAHEVMEEAIIGLLKIHLNPDGDGVGVCKAPELATAATAAVKQVLLTYQEPLCEAVEDLTHAYTYVVETLHSEVLYETYRRLLVLASGIIVTEQDPATAQVGQARERVNGSAPDMATQISKMKAFAQGNSSDGSGSSGTGAIVASVVGGVTQAALFPVLGPFAGPLGAGVGFLVEQAWDAFRDVLNKYKAEYKARKVQLGSSLPDYDVSLFEKDMVPLPWPKGADPMTSFELMCKMMNCDPGYVVEALGRYYEAFGKKLEEKQPDGTSLSSKFDAVQLQRQLIACLSRMLCTHHSMTESVTKLVRMRLMSTHISQERPDRPGLSLPAKLDTLLLQQLKANHQGQLLPLLVTKQTLEARAKLRQQKVGVEEAMKHLQKAFE